MRAFRNTVLFACMFLCLGCGPSAAERAEEKARLEWERSVVEDARADRAEREARIKREADEQSNEAL